MSTENHWPCECLNWARCTSIDLKSPMPNHHPNCQHYNASLMDVWRVTLDGASYVTDRERSEELGG